MLTFGRKCPWCQSWAIFKSHFSTWDYFLLLFLLRPVRCGECFHRHHRPIFFSALPRNAQPTHAEAAGHRLSA